MPRYYFNAYDGQTTMDENGTLLPDLKAARREAVIYAGRLIADHADEFAKDEDWKMEVTDERGLVLFVLTFSVTMVSVGLITQLQDYRRPVVNTLALYAP